MNTKLKIFLSVVLAATGTTILIVGYATQDQVNKLDKKIDSIETSIMNQNAILDRTIGNYIPIKIPDDLNKNISLLEEQGKDTGRWPKDGIELERFSEALGKCIKSTPPWAEKELLPHFNILRWEEAAFRIIISDPQTLDLAYCEDIQRAQIDGVPQQLVAGVKKAAEHAESIMKTSRKTAAIRAAKDSIADEKANHAKALEGLVYLLEENDQEAMTLHEKLYVILINKKAKEQIDALKNSMENVNKISDWQLRQSGYNQISGMATQQYLSWVPEKRISKANLSDLDLLRKNAQVEADNISKERMMAYQKWAFEQIKKLSQLSILIDAACKDGNNSSLDKNVKPLLSEGAKLVFKKRLGKIYGENIENAKEVKREAISMAMIQYLVPINMSLLDLGVSQLYQKAWESNWKQLDGTPDQDEVAKASAVVKKKGLNDELGN